MNWTAAAAIAELVAAVGVVATLLYLAVQIRQNTTALRAATFQNVIGYAAGFAEMVAKDSEVAEIFQSGLADLNSLSETNRFRFHFQLIALLRRYENVYYQSRIGLLDDDQWEGLRASLDRLITQPGSRSWWAANNVLFNSAFRAFIESRLGNANQNKSSLVSH